MSKRKLYGDCQDGILQGHAFINLNFSSCYSQAKVK